EKAPVDAAPARGFVASDIHAGRRCGYGALPRHSIAAAAWSGFPIRLEPLAGSLRAGGARRAGHLLHPEQYDSRNPTALSSIQQARAQACVFRQKRTAARSAICGSSADTRDQLAVDT